MDTDAGPFDQDSGRRRRNGFVDLNVPNPYATGNSNPGGNFGIEVNGAVQPAFASFTYNEANPPSTGRIPTTLCVPFLVNSRESFGSHGGVVECPRLDRAHR